MTLKGLDKWTTWSEFNAQPAIWREWGDEFDPSETKAWIKATGVEEIWLSGAGTSAYIGDIIAAGLEGHAGLRVRSVASTDIVSNPASYLTGRRPLVISFGRSGDSAESLGVLDALDALAPQAPRLNITCNADGALATRTSPGPLKVITLPSATHDAGFAMTASFSTMLLTALAILDDCPDFSARMGHLADSCESVIAQTSAHMTSPPQRVIFLGAGALKYAAREAALKVMELSAGDIPALWDSTLGFRHGPKSFVAPGTDIVIFLSADTNARRYDLDLAEELRAQFPQAPTTTVGPGGDISFDMPWGAAWAAPLAVAHAQMLAIRWSDTLGMNVDNPFAGLGTLTRVVSGVALYPVAP